MVPREEESRRIILGLPKGSLQESTFDLFEKAGFSIRVGTRSYFPDVDDAELEIVLLRAQEIATYVQEGVLDAGITGFDWIKESGADVHEVAELVYAKKGKRPVRWVLAVAADSPVQSAKDLEGKRIATEAVSLTKKYFEDKGVEVKVEFSWGATEIKTPRLVDAIVDITETGSSLKANNLRVVDTVLESTTRLIANKKSWEDTWKRAKMEEIAMLLKSVLAAQARVGLMMNVKKKDLDAVLSVLPALQNPTVSDLSNPDWCDVITIVDKSIVRKLIPQLKLKGAHGIVEYPLSKIIE